MQGHQIEGLRGF